MQSTRVTFYADDGSSQSFEASVAGTDPSRDLAVLSISAPRALLKPIRIGTSADLRTGQFVFAIGNPSGLSRTQTCGVVSGLNRAIPSPTGIRIPGAIQTDAPINAGAPLCADATVAEPLVRAVLSAEPFSLQNCLQAPRCSEHRSATCPAAMCADAPRRSHSRAGNSGGPLLDSSARAVGVCTATFSRQGSGRGSGVNFALPIDMVRTVVPRLIVYGQAGEKRV